MEHCGCLMAVLTAPILLVQADESMQLLVALASAAIPAQTVAPMAMILLQHIMEKISMGGSGKHCWLIVSESPLGPAGRAAGTMLVVGACAKMQAEHQL